ncbi:hypothetical protein K439DRAFT_1661210 [Ramaria rubella]|nr:hypothetical protein K439DRAFT_1661210 [Ramaria rubella]
MSNVNVNDPSSLEGPTVLEVVTQIYRITGALWIMPLCLIMYDILITLDAEAKYFWNGRGGTLARWLYFLFVYPVSSPTCHLFRTDTGRYPLKSCQPSVYIASITSFSTSSIPPQHCTSLNNCSFWFQYVGYSAGAEHMIVGAILILRLYALFDCNRRLLAVLLVLYTISISCETVLIGVVTHQFHSNEALRSVFTGCAPTNIPTWCWWYWVPSLAFESILLLLALYKTVLEARKKMTRTSSLMGVLLRDSVLYFGGVTLFTITNFAAWYIAPLPLYGMFVGCHIGFQSILGCRMLLNIRESAAAATSATTYTTLDTIRFQYDYASYRRPQKTLTMLSVDSDDSISALV